MEHKCKHIVGTRSSPTERGIPEDQTEVPLSLVPECCIVSGLEEEVMDSGKEGRRKEGRKHLI